VIWTTRALMPVLTTALLAGCHSPGQPGTVTRSLTEPDQMAAAVLAATPVGTPLALARSFMEREGFRCTEQANQALGDRTGLEWLYCDRSEGSGLVTRRWQVLVIHRGGKVVDVRASTGLIGL
jgi:hypothetical protein